MSFDTDVTVRLDGKLFDNPEPAVDDAVRDIEETLADEAADMIRARLKTVLKHPTGRYMRSIQVVQKGSMAEVNDSGIVYGPWLEGVSSRNTRSRFKGYATFRRTKQELAQRADTLAEDRVRDLARELS